MKSLKKIGVLGGTFDPPHIAHLEISKLAIKKLRLSELIWAVTKKNPLKKKPYFMWFFDDSIKFFFLIKIAQFLSNH